MAVRNGDDLLRNIYLDGEKVYRALEIRINWDYVSKKCGSSILRMPIKLLKRKVKQVTRMRNFSVTNPQYQKQFYDSVLY